MATTDKKDKPTPAVPAPAAAEVQTPAPPPPAPKTAPPVEKPAEKIAEAKTVPATPPSVASVKGRIVSEPTPPPAKPNHGELPRDLKNAFEDASSKALRELARETQAKHVEPPVENVEQAPAGFFWARRMKVQNGRAGVERYLEKLSPEK